MTDNLKKEHQPNCNIIKNAVKQCAVYHNDNPCDWHICTCLPNPTPSQEDWEKKLLEIVGYELKDDNYLEMRWIEIKSFITQLLNTQRTEILEEIEKELLTPNSLIGNYSIIKDLLTKLKK